MMKTRANTTGMALSAGKEKAPQYDQDHRTSHARSEVRGLGGADANHQRHQQQCVAYTSISGKSGNHQPFDGEAISPLLLHKPWLS